MKFTNKIIPFVLTSAVIAPSCDTHDSFDEIASVGHKAPQVYFEIPSPSVVAGDSVVFRTQYYPTEKALESLELWYGVSEKISYTVTCPLVSSFKYNVSANDNNEVRQAIRVATYEHLESNWDNTLSSYVLTDSFPTSRTLRTFEWKEVKEFDEHLFTTLFTDTFATYFRTDLYSRMQMSDLRRALVLTESMTDEDFRAYTSKYEIDPNSMDTIWMFNNQEDSIKVKEVYDAISFEQLIYNSTDQMYSIEYARSYELSTLFKVVDEHQIAGVSDLKVVELR